MTIPTHRRATLAGLAVAATSASLLLGAPGAEAHHDHAADAHHAAPAVQALPLGPADLPETRTTTTLAPGLTSTVVQRGTASTSLRWVVEVNIPSATTSPDPDAPARSIQDEASAQAVAARLDAAGLAASAQAVQQPAVADLPAAVLGDRVRLDDTFATKAEADAAVARVKALGYSARAWYQGWDGGTAAPGPWTVRVLTIDPQRFRGTIAPTFGPDLEHRETTTALAALTGARAAVNGGFFVMDPSAGAEGDPAGASSLAGTTLSEPVSGRPALLLRDDARHTRVVRPSWVGTLQVDGRPLALDGLNRVPGLVRNCGGDATDSPTPLPRHDVTCTDDAELVAFTPAFGASTPSGPGREVVLDAKDRVVAVHGQRGVHLQPGQRSVQATGSRVAEVARVTVGDRLEVTTRLVAAEANLGNHHTSVVNGGPQLVRDGAVWITQARDGFHQPANPSFDYGWVLQRNPRTFAGTDAQGRTLLVTVDGRQVGQLGLSIPETAAVARSLGMVEAINLDGGGSTSMVIDGHLVNSPSDATGERPVGDAIVIR